MKTCKTCKFSCSKDKYLRHGRLHCRSEKFIYEHSGQSPSDSLVYWDFEGHLAGFDVGEDFGCVHHQPKQDSKEEEKQ